MFLDRDIASSDICVHAGRPTGGTLKVARYPEALNLRYLAVSGVAGSARFFGFWTG